jgi:hypothetical protein
MVALLCGRTTVTSRIVPLYGYQTTIGKIQSFTSYSTV